MTSAATILMTGLSGGRVGRGAGSAQGGPGGVVAQEGELGSGGRTLPVAPGGDGEGTAGGAGAQALPRVEPVEDSGEEAGAERVPGADVVDGGDRKGWD